MSHEIEMKLAVDDRIDWAGRLARYPVLKPRFFEDNYLFDQDGRLMKQASVLRVRLEGSRWVVTFKGPKTVDDAGIKTRLEHETEVQDGNTLIAILDALGYRLWFRYQKYRTVFQADDLSIMLDETPMGLFIELEGPKPRISRVRSELGLDRVPAIPDSYIRLYQSRRRPDDPEYMVF